MEKKLPDRLSARVRRNKDKAVTRFILSFHLNKNRSRTRKQKMSKKYYVQSNIFDENILNFEFCNKHYSIMMGKDENLKDSIYIAQHYL